MRRVLFVTAAVLAAVIFFVIAKLPPRPVAVDTSRIDPDLVRRTVKGAYHIHTSRSDGASDKAAVAAAAARAGLQFIILSDHADGVALVDPPAYVSGVLCIDAVEISTNGGHYVALGMQPSPYPLGGDPSAVVEDVARLGGFGVVAHPDSPKASLAWSGWETSFDGIEWMSADSEWRDEPRTALARTFMSYLIRPGPALASMLDRPVATLKRWDDLTRGRRVVGIAAHDAHGGIGRGMEENGQRKPAFGHVPSYEASFRTFSDNVVLDAPLSGDAVKDGRSILDAIRSGRVFTVIDAVASPGFVDLRAENGAIVIKATLPPGAEIVVIAAGGEVERSAVPEVVARLEPGTAAARVEVEVPGGPGTPPVPWLVSNPVYFRPPSSPRPVAAPGGGVSAGDFTWHIEKDPRSTAALQISGAHVSIDYALGPGARASQFVALAADLRSRLRSARELIASASAGSPMRVSIQFRYAQRGGERWGSSVYLDSTPREIVLPIDRMRPLDRQSGSPPDPSSVSSLLFVVDLTNARPGHSGRFTIGNIRLAQ